MSESNLRELPPWRVSPAVAALLTAWTVLAGTMLAARFHQTGTVRYGFLIWNLILAWVPFGCVLLLPAARRLGAAATALVLATWLAFFPNAPYLVTDLVHVVHSPSLWWYDTMLVLAFSATGMLLALVSLECVHAFVRRHAGRWTGWAVVVTVSFLTGFGIYLGRFVRLNSWDVVTRPGLVSREIADRLMFPTSHTRTWIFTLLFGAMTLACYVTWTGVRSKPSRTA